MLNASGRIRAVSINLLPLTPNASFWQRDFILLRLGLYQPTFVFANQRAVVGMFRAS
jgi:hypothetical protein